MGDFSNSTSLCFLGNQDCLQWPKMLISTSMRDKASTTLGLISVIVWLIADIPQIITNYRRKSTEGLSITFLMTWMIGDVLNLVGCWLEPNTITTQLYTAALYIIISVSLCSQTIYYEHIYPRLKQNRQIKMNIPTNAEECKSETGKANDVDQSNEFDGVGLSYPIPLPVDTHENSVGRPLYYQSARYLSKSYTPIDSILGQRLASSSQSHTVNPIEEHLLGSTTIHTHSAPVLKTKTTLCLISTLTFLGVFNLLHPPGTRIHPMGSKPNQEFVIYVGRKLFQDSVAAHSSIGTFFLLQSSIGTLLGWAMAVIYMGGRLPQICLNIRRGNCKGINPLMFLFAVTGNVAYVSSILARSMDWSRIGPNLPWLIEPSGCALLDSFILMQSLYFQYWTSQGQESKYKHQCVA